MYMKKVEINESIFKAYDIRGLYPEDINPEIARRIASGFVKFLDSPKNIIVGTDIREGSLEMKSHVIDVLTSAGVNVIDIGMVTTDVFYWASVFEENDGGLILSASHNPVGWAGFKFSGKDAVGISSDYGLPEIKKYATKGVELSADTKGKIEERNVLPQYSKFIGEHFTAEDLPKLKIVADANFGVQGKNFEYVCRQNNYPFELILINGEPDSSLPKGAPNPMLEERRKEISDAVLEHDADVGISWDGDGDRCFLIDEKGRFMEGYFSTALIGEERAKKNGGGKVVIDPRLIWASIDRIEAAGGKAIVCKPGYSIIGARMVQEKAIFAGEMSSHFFFPELKNKENALFPALILMRKMKTESKKLSEIYDPLLNTYFVSGEINFTVEESEKLLSELEDTYKDGTIEHIDGLSVEFDQWRFNMRRSNTEPLVRLNLEARSQDELDTRLAEVRVIIDSYTS